MFFLGLNFVSGLKTEKPLKLKTVCR